jgi:nitroimidazol reductase NimA-like FMN-containing flavoprotein (pyridoxamine 5'-phosphate oxidase superfamily)
MCKKTALSFFKSLAFSIILLQSTAIVVADDERPQGRNVGAGERGVEAIVFDAQPISSDVVKSDKHINYQRGMVCAECHHVTFDLATTATKQFTNNFPQLTNDEIWEKIEAFLPGRERFALTTSYNGEPTATTVDMVLDKKEKVLYVVSEKGTEKLLHIRKNPNISAVRFHGWTVADGGKKEWRSTQIKGTAEIIEYDDPRFDELLTRYNLVRMTKERAHLRFDLIRITPTQIYYFDTTLSANSPDSDYSVDSADERDRLSVYQLWQRN